DLYGRERAARVMSTLMTIMAVAPLVGPLLGSIILEWMSWRAIFGVLVAIGLLTMAGLFSFPETLAPENRNHEPLSKAFAAYGWLLTQRRLLGYAGATGFFYCGTFAYIAGGPFAFVEFHGMSPQLFAIVFAVGIAGVMATNQINIRLVP